MFLLLSLKNILLRALKNCLNFVDAILRSCFIALIQIYKLVFSPFMGWSCRFYPTCSCYARQSFEKHNFFFAFLLTTKRIFQCRPFGPEGYDPVPEKTICWRKHA